MAQQPLWHRLHFNPLYVALVNKIGYLGFPLRELADQCRSLTEKYQPKDIALALQAIANTDDHWVQLTEESRKLAWQLLGPPPESWDRFYRNLDGSPGNRPKGRQKPPKVPKKNKDPIMASVGPPITNEQLRFRLRDARKDTKKHGKTSKAGKLARETILCIESELLSRGLEIPAEGEEVSQHMQKQLEEIKAQNLDTDPK